MALPARALGNSFIYFSKAVMTGRPERPDPHRSPFYFRPKCAIKGQEMKWMRIICV